jgi:hypothetical protein
MQRVELQIAGVALVLAGALACAGGDDLDRRIPVEPGGLLEVDVDRGEGLRPDPGWLEVRSHDAHEVRIVTEAREWGASGVAFTVDSDGHTVRVLGRVGGSASWLFGGPRVEVTVWVPREFDLDLRCNAGPVRIEDTRGRVRVRTEGEVDVSRVEGDLRIRAGSDVRVAELSGALDVRSDGGDVTVRWVRGGAELRTGGGEIEASNVSGGLLARSASGRLELRDVEGPIEAVTESGSVFATFGADPAGRLETGRGDVKVWLPSTAGVALEAVSRRGEVDVGPELDLAQEPQDGRLEGALAGGGPPLRLFTARGRVEVQLR